MLLRKLFQLFNTVRHLKGRQLFYQVYYRLKKPVLPSVSGFKQDGPTIWLSFSDFLKPIPCANSEGRFEFLNRSMKFNNEINWAFNGNGKLWNYNLHYANWLLQEDIPVGIRLAWLKSLHTSLFNKVVIPEPYPISLRIINTIRLLCRHKTEDAQIQKALLAESIFLSRRFEFHLMGNHLLENAFALFMAGSFFNQQNWKIKATNLLRKELEEQVLPDGAHFELSPMYHQVVLFRLLELIDWYDQYEEQQVDLMEFFKNKASLMLGWLNNIGFSNNEIPYFNDSAPNITYDSASLVAFAINLKLAPATNLSLSKSGYRLFRIGNYECVVDAAAIGPDNQPGHGHADALSFLLQHKGQPILVEAGTSTYETGERRFYERSTAAHNTVVINQANQSDLWGAFRVGHRARVTILNETESLFKARHNGYLHRFGTLHERSFAFSETQVTILDKIINSRRTENIALFHFHPNVQVDLTAPKVHLAQIGSLKFEGAMKISSETYSFSNGFNKTIPAIVVKVLFKTSLTTVINLS